MEQEADHAPLPWKYQFTTVPNANGGVHLYLVDANGRRIAAIWGKHAEKLATAQLILDAVNPPDVAT